MSNSGEIVFRSKTILYRANRLSNLGLKWRIFSQCRVFLIKSLYLRIHTIAIYQLETDLHAAVVCSAALSPEVIKEYMTKHPHNDH